MITLHQYFSSKLKGFLWRSKLIRTNLLQLEHLDCFTKKLSRVQRSISLSHTKNFIWRDPSIETQNT